MIDKNLISLKSYKLLHSSDETTTFIRFQLTILILTLYVCLKNSHSFSLLNRFENAFSCVLERLGVGSFAN